MNDDVFGIRDKLAALDLTLKLLKEGREMEKRLRCYASPEEVEAIAQRLTKMQQEQKMVEGDRQ